MAILNTGSLKQIDLGQNTVKLKNKFYGEDFCCIVWKEKEMILSDSLFGMHDYDFVNVSFFT